MEIYKIALVICFVMLSGFFQGQMEKIAFDFYNSIYIKRPDFFNPKLSFRNKYRQLTNKVFFTDQDGSTHYVHEIDKSKERFFLSTTVFVWLTDGWHLFKVISGTFLSIALTICIMEIFSLNIYMGLIVFAGVKLINSISYVSSFKIK